MYKYAFILTKLLKNAKQMQYKSITVEESVS